MRVMAPVDHLNVCVNVGNGCNDAPVPSAVARRWVREIRLHAWQLCARDLYGGVRGGAAFGTDDHVVDAAGWQVVGVRGGGHELARRVAPRVRGVARDVGARRPPHAFAIERAYARDALRARANSCTAVDDNSA